MRLPRPLLVLTVTATVGFASSAHAAPGQVGGTDPAYDNGYNAPDITAVAGVWDGEMLAFGIDATQTYLYSGDRLSIQVDANRDTVADYLLMLECCPVGWWMGAWNGSGWFVDIPQSSYSARFANGQAQFYVNRAQVGMPQDTLWFRAQTGFAAINSWDLAPHTGWFVLPQETSVAGASGPASGGGTTPAPAPAPQPPPAAAPAPTLDAQRGRAAIRRMVRRKLGRRARIRTLRCDADLRCRLVVRRGRWRYAGTASVRVLQSGAYRAVFTGTRSRPGCGRRCRSTVRW